jgi:hypothetical protein
MGKKHGPEEINGTSVMRCMEELFVQAVTSLADLAALPSVDGAFANGSIARTARIGENRMVQVGVLASDVATDLF